MKLYTKENLNTRYPIFNLGFEYYNAETKEKKDEIKLEFMQFLKSLDGWVNAILEGGFISPDHNTIIWYNRSPYDFQIGAFTQDGIEITEQRIKEFEKLNLI